MAARSHITRLFRRDGITCHYCGVVCVKNKLDQNGHMTENYNPRMATKDHVVPKSMGGLGKLENFVLACRECNEHRGDQLHYCGCLFCENVIATFFQRVFAADHFGPVKPKVWKHHDGTWVMSVGLNSYGWATWNSAMRQVPNMKRINA